MNRGRKPGEAAQQVDAQVDNDATTAASQAMTELAKRSAEIASRFDDGLPYDRNRMVNEAKHFMGQSAEAMLEAGKRLIVLKENEPHGEFTGLVENRLGLNDRTARRMMVAAVKYLSPALESKRTALSVLGKTKLLELMVEDDGDLAAVAEGGTVAGLNLDDMQAMTSRELRAALVESRKKNADKDRVIAKKDEKLNQQAEAEERRSSASRSEAEAQHLHDMRDATLQVELGLTLLLSRLDGVMACPPTEACELAARHALDYVCQRLADAATKRGMALNFADQVVPLHMAPVHDVVAAYQATQAAKPGKPGKA